MLLFLLIFTTTIRHTLEEKNACWNTQGMPRFAYFEGTFSKFPGGVPPDPPKLSFSYSWYYLDGIIFSLLLSYYFCLGASPGEGKLLNQGEMLNHCHLWQKGAYYTSISKQGRIFCCHPPLCMLLFLWWKSFLSPGDAPRQKWYESKREKRMPSK